MIRGLGIDVVEIERVEAALCRWEDRFLRRVFTEAEVALCQGRSRPGACLALRFAAKEAFAKALGSGFRQGLRWVDIEVVKEGSGSPGLRLHGRARELLVARGARKTWLSLSDQSSVAVAVVILEG